MHRIAAALQAHLPAATGSNCRAQPCGAGVRRFEAMFFPTSSNSSASTTGRRRWSARTLHPLSSSEFAVRPFIARQPGRTLARMLDWAGHHDEHLRRLASEGSRPRLPWQCGCRN